MISLSQQSPRGKEVGNMALVKQFGDAKTTDHAEDNGEKVIDDTRTVKSETDQIEFGCHGKKGMEQIDRQRVPAYIAKRFLQ